MRRAHQPYGYTDLNKIEKPLMIKLKSIYDPRQADDGYRIFVDAEWPRGVARGKSAGCDWMKSLGPSVGLRGWMSRNTLKISQFQDKYLSELGRDDKNPDRVCKLLKEYGTVTILFVPDDQWGVADTLYRYLKAHCGLI